ncbi:DUF169 domain-containing protein [Methanimicrococcus sp. OttesenSCG-928-J09]|nr:DUF169 domain-containing protein [Methanimicrococcus sp. OttesenSCG-928-J09]
MNHKELLQELNLQTHILAITRKNTVEAADPVKAGCTLRGLNKVLNDGETIVLSAKTTSCRGGNRGFGFDDELPPTPGGVGWFLSCGRGEGFPAGERIKATPEIGEQMLLNQPMNVLNGNEFIEIKPYEDGDEPDIVSFLINPDQLAALVTLFSYRSIDYDNVIAPMLSGCASLFRIPFGELEREKPRAVIGNMDIFSRPHFPKETVFITVPGAAFKSMLSDADECFFIAPIWKGIKKRL